MPVIVVSLMELSLTLILCMTCYFTRVKVDETGSSLSETLDFISICILPYRRHWHCHSSATWLLTIDVSWNWEHIWCISMYILTRSMTAMLIGQYLQASELCAVGSILGLVQSVGGAGLVKVHQLRDPEFKPSLPLPEVKRASTGLAAYMGIVANLRYQAVSGADRYLSYTFLRSLALHLAGFAAKIVYVKLDYL